MKTYTKEEEKKEARKLIRFGVWLGILFIFLILASQLTLATCDNFEPLGACPEVDYPGLRPAITDGVNTLSENSNNYQWNYTVPGGNNLTFNLAKPSLVNQTAAYALFSVQSGEAWYYMPGKTNSIAERLWDFDPSFEVKNGSQTLYMNASSSLVQRNVSNYTITGTQMRVAFLYIFLNKSTSGGYSPMWTATIYYTANITGKMLELNMHMPPVQGVQYIGGSASRVISTTAGNFLRVVNMDGGQIQTMGLNEIIVVGDDVFFNIDYILDKSDFSEDISTSGSSTESSSTTIHYNKGTRYNNLTNGTRNPLNDTFFFVISDNVYDVMVANPQNQSPVYDEIKDTWAYGWWDATGINRWNITQRYMNYGFDMTKGILFSSNVASPNPDRRNYLGSNNRNFMLNLSGNFTNVGLCWGMYNSMRDIPGTNSFYFNTTTSPEGIFYNGTNHSYCMKNSNGTLKTSFDGTGCVMRWEKREEAHNIQASNYTDWGLCFLYLDTEGANTFSDNDYDANSTMRGILRNQFPVREAFYDYSRDILGLFTLTENFRGLYTAGMIDGGIGRDCCDDENDNRITPGYTSLHVSSKQVMYADYLRRIMKSWNNDAYTDYGDFASDPVQYEKSIAVPMVYREALHIDGHTSALHNIPDNLTILKYYMSKKIIELEYEANLINESYYSAGSWLSLSQALMQNYTTSQAMIYEKWSNGLHVYANFNTTVWWNTTINGAMRLIPPNGVYAYNDAGTFELFFLDANASSWVITDEYTYIHPKNEQNITLNGIPQNIYTPQLFYGNQASNGRRNLTNTEIITSYSTTQVVLLIPQGLTVEEEISQEILESGLCEDIPQNVGLLSLFLMALPATLILFIVIRKGEGVDFKVQTIAFIVLALTITIAFILVSKIVSAVC